MRTPLIEGLRNIALNVPDLERAEAFYTNAWNLHVVGRQGGALYLRGTGRDPYLLALYQGGPLAQLRCVTLRARSEAALDEIAQNSVAAGGSIFAPLDVLDEPAGGRGFTLRDPQGRLFQIVHGDALGDDVDQKKDRPVRLAHVVLNSSAPNDTRKFLEEAMAFRLADLTVRIAFMNCNADHHTVGVAIADNNALNHIAFLMPDGDSLMRGAGRMRDAGYPIEWGPGRHGPGDNLFNYFVDPFGVPIEYTAEVQQVDETYKPRGPEDWKWPPGRIDQWGISAPPTSALKEAQARVHFVS